jgi:POT family proton-dependent oligopeptide transporter
MLVYLMSIPGGMIADKLIGQKKAVLVGAIVLCIGHGVVLTQTWAFYTGLGLVVWVGLLKAQYFDHGRGFVWTRRYLKDKGFSIFYIGINTGSLWQPWFGLWLQNGDGMLVLD